ncbi:MAG: DUF6048 family protein [Bacteroidales bacterium]|nr:DUF6048 family protein [Bacteroidales bacterium]
MMGLLRCFIYSFLIIILVPSVLYAQDDEKLYAEEEIKEPLKLKGIKFGVNVGRLSDFQFKPERKSYEASVDFNLSNKYFGVLEAGYSEIFINKDLYKYKSDGMFCKLGFDYNMLKNYPTDFFGIGVRMGWANFSHLAYNIKHTSDNWGTVTLPNKSKSYNAYWVEFSLGIKGEIFKNIYIGWSGIVQTRISGGKDDNFQPYDIPGYGSTSKAIKLAANYYIYYQIPINRK